MSQIRVTIEGEGYSLLKRLEDGAVILENEEGGFELWQENDDFAGFVLTIDDIGFEFVRTY